MKNERNSSIELDLLPEHTHYVDEGCDMSPSCLSCPLERCVYDSPHGKQALLKRRRNDEILRVYREEHPPLGEMARIFKVSIRTVQRALKAGKDRKDKRTTPHSYLSRYALSPDSLPCEGERVKRKER